MSELTYEQARDELVALVARIESGTVPLEEAMLLWERGEQLAAHCQAKLDLAQETLDRTTGAAGRTGEEGGGAQEEDTREDTGEEATGEEDAEPADAPDPEGS